MVYIYVWHCYLIEFLVFAYSCLWERTVRTKKLDKENLKRMHNIYPTLAPLPHSNCLISKEISLDYGRTESSCTCGIFIRSMPVHALVLLGIPNYSCKFSIVVKSGTVVKFSSSCRIFNSENL